MPNLSPAHTNHAVPTHATSKSTIYYYTNRIQQALTRRLPPPLTSLTFSPNPTFPPLRRYLLFGPSPRPSPGPSSGLTLGLNLSTFRPSSLTNLTLPPSSHTPRGLSFSFAFTFACGYPKN